MKLEASRTPWFKEYLEITDKLATTGDTEDTEVQILDEQPFLCVPSFLCGGEGNPLVDRGTQLADEEIQESFGAKVAQRFVEFGREVLLDRAEQRDAPFRGESNSHRGLVRHRTGCRAREFVRYGHRQKSCLSS
jgi:hypothetical protein